MSDDEEYSSEEEVVEEVHETKGDAGDPEFIKR